jgi:hypothetical protein
MPIPLAAAFDAVWVGTGTATKAWTTGANWSPANAPTAGEDILIPAGTAPIDCTSMTSNILYGSLVIERGHQYPIGTSSNPLTGAFGQILHKGNGLVTFDGTVGSGADTTALITVASGRGRAPAMSIDGTAIDYIRVFRGDVTLEDSMAALALLEVGMISDPTGDVLINTGSNSNALTKVIQRAGRIVGARLITLLEQTAGDCVQQVGQAITEANVNGTLNYQSETTATTIRVGERGMLDVTTGREGVATITTLYTSPGSKYEADPRVIVTNPRLAEYLARP